MSAQGLGPRQRALVGALRSGRYRQGSGRLEVLREEGGEVRALHCCLGVACREAIGMGLAMDIGSGNLCLGTATEFDGQRSVLPPSAMEFFGFRSPNGYSGPFSKGAAGDFKARALTKLNDRGVAFSEIASAIEADPGFYFEGAM